MIPAHRQRNYLQSALYVIIASILAAFLLERLLTYAEIAEKTSMEATLSTIHSALYAQVAYLALRGQREAMEELPRRNPFTVTQARATNYVGEFDAVPADIERGNWLFHRTDHELLYLPKYARYFASPADGLPPVLRYRIDLLRTTGGAVAGVTLTRTDSARWEPAL